MKNIITCKRVDVDIDLINSARKDLSLADEKLNENANILSLLGNEVRLKIIYIFLRFNRMCVCDLSDVLGMKQSPISQHLRKLKDARLIVNKREGMTIFYSISENQKENLKRIIESLGMII